MLPSCLLTPYSYFQVRVAHFEPDKITITGEGVFPRVIFDLSLDKQDPRYDTLTQQAIENLGRERSAQSERSVDYAPFSALADVSSLPLYSTVRFNLSHRLLGAN